ncbi:MAG: hypothetical protein J0L82_14330 [Deltaproteobacteria bacterium]|nr:hypothetical protein [Deltaproteobacteria bacterium]
MTLFFYDLLQPLALGLFRAAVALLRAMRIDSASKLVKTLEIRTVNGRPAFESIQIEKFLGQKPIWIHAASGEFEYAKPVVRELHRLGRTIFVTYFSPTYKSNIESFPGVTASCALPLEDKSQLREMIHKIRPSALLISRTDTWPNMVRECSHEKVPVLLFSATFHSGSKRIGWVGRSLTKATYKLIDEIQCVNDEDLALLLSLGYKRGVARGDTRYDQVLERLKHPKPLPEKLRADKHARDTEGYLLTAGSVWEEDVQALLPAIVETKNALKTGERFSCHMVPHEISDRFSNSIKKQAQSFGLKTAILSELESDSEFEILIVDQIGILAELYMLGQFAFVGGSFKKTVHSVMEPLAAGCLTFVGPFHSNNREAVEFQTEACHSLGTSVIAATDTAGLGSALLSAVQQFGRMSAIERASLRETIQNQVRAKGGATEAVLNWLKVHQT